MQRFQKDGFIYFKQQPFFFPALFQGSYGVLILEVPRWGDILEQFQLFSVSEGLCVTVTLPPASLLGFIWNVTFRFEIKK